MHAILKCIREVIEHTVETFLVINGGVVKRRLTANIYSSTQ